MSDDKQSNDTLSRRRLITATGALAAGVSAAAAGAAQAAAPVVLPRPVDKADRAFVRVREGLIHYRHTLEPGHKGGRRGKTLPLFMVHAGPGSSRGFEPQLAKLAPQRMGVAPDTLGFGDSCVPDQPNPDIGYYADNLVRIMDALGLDQVDVYGAHTGAHSGAELALRHPDRVRRLILDGVTVRSPELRKELRVKYAPKRDADDYGSQMMWAWQFVRNVSQYFPHYSRDAANKTVNGVPSAEALEANAIDLLKARPTHHLAYAAVYDHDIGARLAQLKQPTMCIAYETNPNIGELEHAAAQIPGAKVGRIPRGQGVDTQVKLVNDFLNA